MRLAEVQIENIVRQLVIDMTPDGSGKYAGKVLGGLE